MYRLLLIMGALLLPGILYPQLITWSSLNEPGSGGRITDIGIHPQNPDHLLIAGDMLGIALSTDGGQSWQSTFGFRSYEMGALTFHPSEINTIWVGSMSGPYKSIDGGLTWVEKRKGMDPIKDGSYSCPIEIILFDPTDDTHLMAFGGSKREWNSPGQPRWNVVWESIDGGESWKELATIGVPQKPGITSAQFLTSSKLIAAVKDQGVYMSNDSGKTWEKSINGLPANPRVFHVASPAGQSNVVYASLDNYEVNGTYQAGGIYRSTNGGSSWTQASSGLQQSSHSNPNIASYYKTIKVAPSDPNTLYTANSGWTKSGVFKSTDGADSWTPILEKSSTNNFPKAFYDAAGPELSMFDIGTQNANLFVGGNSSYVFRTKNGGNTWEDLLSIPTSVSGYFKGNGFCGLVSRQVAFNPFDPNYCALLSMDNGKFVHSNDNLQSWKRDGEDMPNYNGGNEASYANANTLYCTTGQSVFEGVWRSTDQGQTWKKFGIEKFPGASADKRPLGIYALPGNGNTAWVALDDKIYQTENAGASWSIVLEKEGLNYMHASLLAPEKLYVNSRDGVYVTTNGKDFTLMPGSPKSGFDILVDPNDAELIYVTKWRSRDDEGGLWKYQDGIWNHIKKDEFIQGVAVQPGNSNVIVVGTSDQPFHDVMNSTGIWISLDGGSSWDMQNEGLPFNRAGVVAFNPHRPEQLIAGTQGRGFFTGILDNALSIDKDQLANELHVYPNPTRERIYIQHSRALDHVELFTLNQQLIRTQECTGAACQLSTQELLPGVYLLGIAFQTGEILYQKIIVQP